MRWIFRYTPEAKKHIERILKSKIKVEPQPWLHIAVKTMSKRNPWAGYAIYVWDTRQIVGEYRSNKGLFTTEQFVKGVSGMSRAIDGREPLVGGRNKDTNEFFEFGDFDASKSDVFDGKDRVKETELFKRRNAKMGMEVEPQTESADAPYKNNNRAGKNFKNQVNLPYSNVDTNDGNLICKYIDKRESFRYNVYNVSGMQLSGSKLSIYGNFVDGGRCWVTYTVKEIENLLGKKLLPWSKKSEMNQ